MKRASLPFQVHDDFPVRHDKPPIDSISKHKKAFSEWRLRTTTNNLWYKMKIGGRTRVNTHLQNQTLLLLEEDHLHADAEAQALQKSWSTGCSFHCRDHLLITAMSYKGRRKINQISIEISILKDHLNSIDTNHMVRIANMDYLKYIQSCILLKVGPLHAVNWETAWWTDSKINKKMTVPNLDEILRLHFRKRKRRLSIEQITLANKVKRYSNKRKWLTIHGSCQVTILLIT